MSLVIATHNLMHGRRIDALVGHHVELRDRTGLALLALQEDRYLEGEGPGDARPSVRVAAALGDGYQVLRDDGCPGLAFVVASRVLRCRAVGIIPLPRLASLSWFERRYILGGKTKQKYALWAELEAGGPPFIAVCFHLDTAGGHRQRQAQVEMLTAGLTARGLTGRLVACGDTNAFSWWPGRRRLDALLAPLAALGATDPEPAPTHFFARQRERPLPHRIGVALGKLGIDIPLRYDVVCTNLPVVGRGQVSTDGSDHDLVWAAVDVAGRSW
ncbi:MAG TPA: hypothetical protein VHG72_09745 [Polyangia bacterium]|nr:hypothetical protein [Polyangia bacterium]